MTETTEDAIGEPIRVCHKKGRITEANDRSYTVRLELGGVNQDIVVSADHVHTRLDVDG